MIPWKYDGDEGEFVVYFHTKTDIPEDYSSVDWNVSPGILNSN